MSTNPNRPRTGAVRAIDAVRQRRASQAKAVGQGIGRGLTVNERKEIEVVQPPGFDYDADGNPVMLIDETFLTLLPGSPRRYSLNLQRLPMLQIVTTAVPEIADIRATPERVTEVDARVTAAIQDALTRIGVLESATPLQRESGTGTLSGGRLSVSSSLALADLTLCSITVTRLSPGSSPGDLYIDGLSDGSFNIESTDGSDDGDVHWSVVR